MRKFSTVKMGSYGTDVTVLQSMLRALQYRGADGKALDITGVCDKNLVYAINAFQEIQRAYGVECGTNGKNDSSFGPACWKRLLGVE